MWHCQTSTNHFTYFSMFVSFIANKEKTCAHSKVQLFWLMQSATVWEYSLCCIFQVLQRSWWWYKRQYIPGAYITVYNNNWWRTCSRLCNNFVSPTSSSKWSFIPTANTCSGNTLHLPCPDHSVAHPVEVELYKVYDMVFCNAYFGNC